MPRSSTTILTSLSLIAVVGVAYAISSDLVLARTFAAEHAAVGAAMYLPAKSDRVAMAEDLEKTLLKEGHDVRVRAQGKDGKTLTVKWSFTASPFAFSVTSDDRLIKKLQDAGFTSVHFDNGQRFWDQQIE